jgi:hypothetical protein
MFGEPTSDLEYSNTTKYINKIYARAVYTRVFYIRGMLTSKEQSHTKLASQEKLFLDHTQIIAVHSIEDLRNMRVTLGPDP